MVKNHTPTKTLERQKQRALKVAEVLESYFPDPAVPLAHKDAYTLLVAVLLSAQSTDKRVNEVTPALFALADTPEKMALVEVGAIEEIIRPCGLGPTKAKAIQGLSKILVEEYQSRVPDTLEELERLPGVGHKTASVVLIQAFQKPAFPVDTHIFRCAKRWGLSSATTVAGVEADLKKLFPSSTWIKLHLQIIYFARAYCPARAHHSESCPLCSSLQIT